MMKGTIGVRGSRDGTVKNGDFMKISARNQIPGTVKSIKKGPVSTEVVITIAGGNEVVSSITTHSAEHLKLREGSKVYAVVKASEVMVGID